MKLIELLRELEKAQKILSQFLDEVNNISVNEKVEDAIEIVKQSLDLLAVAAEDLAEEMEDAIKNEEVKISNEVTRREFFAMAAMEGLIAQGLTIPYLAAKKSVEFADALIKELENQ